jgi:hypothetical protein
MLMAQELARLTAPLSRGVPSWSWEESLAFAEPGRRYRVKRVLFELVSEHCAELGFGVGDEIACRSNRLAFVCCRVPRGRLARLPRSHAWFIQIEPVRPRCPLRPVEAAA